MKVFVTVFMCILVVSELRADDLLCQNPNERKGYCVNINNCFGLKSVNTKSKRTFSESRFIQESRCGDGNFVCCAGDTDFDSTYLLPQPLTCGGDIAHIKILGGNETAISEFAWMVLLEYRRFYGSEPETPCGGSLLNHRYVVTAAHCLVGSYASPFGTLVSVRLGEHDTRTSEDCLGGICSRGVKSVAIEEIHVHKNYVPDSEYWHDIGLIRLQSAVKYSPTIRPICLPSTVGGRILNDGQFLTVAGWGHTVNGGTGSPTLQKVRVPFVENDTCMKKYESIYMHVNGSKICAGGRSGVNSCGGDSGGPLMSYDKGSWILQGIVSSGRQQCGSNWPALYTNVAEYENWIKEKMRP
ncbi:serine protease 7-like [Drosophila rhopaloa]|uniref:CLIP domain-containing serine protease n=1 Tax=Drosophila rhopaloa TaxID=1041015 RepID=A0ABM5J6N2_DRORH|nr:serine protease 7-like [Drosophila rhopaloa]